MSSTHATDPRLFWAPRAWLAGVWREHVLLRVDTQGLWAEIAPGVAAPPPGATTLPGPVLPSLVDAHSHAFQRAMAGLAERREAGEDDFWLWRDRMYRVALRITPDQLRAIAAQLYVELLRDGYTQVCEFHYPQSVQSTFTQVVDGRVKGGYITRQYGRPAGRGRACGAVGDVLALLHDRVGTV